MTRPRIVIITQARMGSTRLPGKVLKEAAGKTLLQHHLERLGRVRHADRVVCATTDNPADDVLADHAQSLGVPVVRGSEADVLDRFHRAALAHQAGIIVRVTSDCPLIDPVLIDELLEMVLGSDPPPDHAGIDVSVFPRGLDAEAVRFEVLDEAWRLGHEPFEREHVTPYIYRRPERFRLALLTRPGTIPGPHRWCVDTAEDFELVRRLLETLLPGNPGFGWQDVLAVLRDHPDWAALNQGVVQKTLT
ncbi:MAG TPA: glycosyltransferase family protein [Azospirillaceae bacterium]|nr:glycosyltransferase family protein [Azospirillaceae bacterium]